MTPIRELLSRVRWDPAFGQGRFELACYDRVTRALERIPLRAIVTETGKHFSFQVRDAAGEVRDIPFHRVREVYRDGELIWSRPVRR